MTDISSQRTDFGALQNLRFLPVNPEVYEGSVAFTNTDKSSVQRLLDFTKADWKEIIANCHSLGDTESFFSESYCFLCRYYEALPKEDRTQDLENRISSSLLMIEEVVFDHVKSFLDIKSHLSGSALDVLLFLDRHQNSVLPDAVRKNPAISLFIKEAFVEAVFDTCKWVRGRIKQDADSFFQDEIKALSSSEIKAESCPSRSEVIMPTTVPLAIFGLEGDFLTSPSVIGLSPERLIAYSKDLLDVIQGKSNGHARELMIENRAKTTVVYGVLGSLFRDLFNAVKEQDTVKDSGNSIEQFHRFLEELGKVYWDTIGKISGGIAPVVNEDVGQESKFIGNNIKIFKAQLQERFYSQAEKVVSYLKDRSKDIGKYGVALVVAPYGVAFGASLLYEFLPSLPPISDRGAGLFSVSVAWGLIALYGIRRRKSQKKSSGALKTNGISHPLA